MGKKPVNRSPKDQSCNRNKNFQNTGNKLEIQTEAQSIQPGENIPAYQQVGVPFFLVALVCAGVGGERGGGEARARAEAIESAGCNLPLQKQCRESLETKGIASFSQNQ
uniref:Uncharacterized protein n=1 Tax=Oryza rufipogon TaxID=4529 RepID=A0A0E0NKR3_ORYRU